MDYLLHYNKLIFKAQLRETDQKNTYECHHIIPRCMGGSDQISNLVYLLPEEHYLAHLLLAKAYPAVAGLWFACQMMMRTAKSNKKYAWVRKQVAKHLKLATLDRWAKKYGYNNYEEQVKDVWIEYTTKKHTVAQIAERKGMAIGNVRRSLNFYAQAYDAYDILKQVDFSHRSKKLKKIRRSFTPEQENRRIEALRNIDYEERSKKTGSRVAEKNPVFGKRWKHKAEKCPHCNKIVAGKRWHFDNCRNRK